ncbi:MAG: ABC transporter ATP-binding protein, partial [Neglectibacter sp.]
KQVQPLYVDLRERLSQLNTSAQENISGNRVVKAFARENYEIAKFDEKNEAYKTANTKASLLWLKFSPYIDGVSQSLAIAVLLVGGIFLIWGRISIGTFTLFNSLCWTLTNPMRMLGMHINDLQRFFASANKIIELYYSKSTITSRADAKKVEGRLRGEVEFRNVDLTLHGAKVLKDISLHVAPGETLAIMGPTGSGKSSLVSLIPRFSDVTKGAVCVDGVPVGMYPLHDLRASVGLATQEVFLFSDTVDGNIAYGDTSLSEEEVKRFAKMADVDFAEKLPDGFDTVIGERGTGLSGGQKQRIALARALAVRPSILILDDTTSAVDLETEKYIQEQLSNLDFPCTKIIVAQRISTTKRADKIAVLEHGEITQYGTHEELSKKPGYYREVFLLQNGMEETEGEAI